MLSDLTHLPPFGARLASQEGPGNDQPAGVLLFSMEEEERDSEELFAFIGYCRGVAPILVVCLLPARSVCVSASLESFT